MGRKMQKSLPMKASLLKPHYGNMKVKLHCQDRQQTVKYKTRKKSLKALPDNKLGNTVRMPNSNSKTWDQAQVIDTSHLKPWSFYSSNKQQNVPKKL